MIDEKTLKKINEISKKELKGEEVFVFDVVLCDNEIDRDCERFSDQALLKLSKEFLGKAGIFDHEMKARDQCARIFDTEVICTGRKNSIGEEYKMLKARAYMLKNDENKGLISDILGGIKKEVSVSCAVNDRRCSICGKDKRREGCEHQKGKSYGTEKCHVILDDVTDAFEWSFVAVPAQKNAGVMKSFSFADDREFWKTTAEKMLKNQKTQAKKMIMLEKGDICEGLLDKMLDGLNADDLIALNDTLTKKEKKRKAPFVQFFDMEHKCERNNDVFKI